MARLFKTIALSRAAFCASITCQLIAFAATIACAQPAAAADSSPAVSSYPSAGTTIDATNIEAYKQILPAAAQLAVSRGLDDQDHSERKDSIGRAASPPRPGKYSAQVGLDKTDAITNYVAGMPFPDLQSQRPEGRDQDCLQLAHGTVHAR